MAKEKVITPEVEVEVTEVEATKVEALVKVQVIAGYEDLQLKVTKNIGDEFEVDKTRAEYLAGLGLVKII